MNQPVAHTERSTIAATGFGTLAGHKYCRLTTFKRSGAAVPTPMWFAVDGERLYMKTDWPSGKARRIRNDARVEIAPCTVRGRALGDALDGRARLLDAGDEARAERVLRGRYGVGRRLFVLLVEPILRLRGHAGIYIEVVPAVARP